MHILHIIPSLNLGGAERTLANICMHDVGNDHSVVVFESGGALETELKNSSVLVKHIRLKRRFIVGSFALRKFARHNPPDLVIGWMYHSSFIASLVFFSKRNVCWNIRHLSTSDPSLKFSTAIIADLLGVISWLPVVNRIIFCSYASRDNHVKSGYICQKSIVIHNGVSDRFFLLSPRAEASQREFTIGVFGRYVPEKDYEKLFHAIKHISTLGVRCRLLIAGAGCSNTDPMFSLLLRSIEDSLIDVQAFGVVQDVLPIMASCDVVVSSSKSESFPNVLAEAMASSRLCVATDVGESGYIVADTGWVIPVSDSLALGSSILAAKNLFEKNHGDFLTRTKHARSRAEKLFSISRMLLEYNNVFKSSLTTR